MTSSNLGEAPLDDPQWKSVEKVVALLEQILTPDATVRHNVFLPVVGHPNRHPRQCDVVITFGRPPRETIAIVEVQKRQEKPDINTFNGWVEKMREVGAQRLFCVSAQGYPSSIIDKAVNDLGPTVVLLHLEDLEENRIPGIVLSPVLLYRHRQFTAKSLGKVGLKAESPQSVTPAKMSLNTSDKLFRIGEDGDVLSLDHVIARILERSALQTRGRPIPPKPEHYTLDLEIGEREPDLWFTVEGTFHKVVRLPVTLEVETKATRVPLFVQGYRQENIAGALAWVASAEGDVGGRAVRVRIVFRPGDNGILQIASVSAEGVADLQLWLSPDKAVIESAIGPVFGGTTK